MQQSTWLNWKEMLAVHRQCGDQRRKVRESLLTTFNVIKLTINHRHSKNRWACWNRIARNQNKSRKAHATAKIMLWKLGIVIELWKIAPTFNLINAKN